MIAWTNILAYIAATLDIEKNENVLTMCLSFFKWKFSSGPNDLAYFAATLDGEKNEYVCTTCQFF